MPGTLENLIVKDSGYGNGVYAGRAFHVGEELLHFSGEFFNLAQVKVLRQTLPDYYLQIGPDLFVGPSGGMDDMFNHSCDPNAKINIQDRDVWLSALRDIAPGEQVCFDYSTMMCGDDETMECGCGSPLCRGVIRDFPSLPKELQDHYIALGAVPAHIVAFVQGK